MKPEPTLEELKWAIVKAEMECPCEKQLGYHNRLYAQCLSAMAQAQCQGILSYGQSGRQVGRTKTNVQRANVKCWPMAWTVTASATSRYGASQRMLSCGYRYLV